MENISFNRIGWKTKGLERHLYPAATLIIGRVMAQIIWSPVPENSKYGLEEARSIGHTTAVQPHMDRPVDGILYRIFAESSERFLGQKG
jgi:hypothetical protein